MTNNADYLALRESMRSIYRACSEGSESPAHIVTNGGLINEMVGEPVCDPAKAYIVSKKNGIKELDVTERNTR
jgi:hypothetical protein